MRPKFNRQVQFDFQPSRLKVTREYYARYEAISKILDQNPRLVDAVQIDIHAALEEELDPETGVATYCCCTETVLRLIVCQVIERCSLRRIIIHVDDSSFLRRFVRIYNDPMIDFTTLARLRNRIRPQTWQGVHQLLNRWAVRSGRIGGQKLRLDTTAVPTNIHWPTDSALLWDRYRVLARLLKRLREAQPGLIRQRRLHSRRVRRLYLSIARRARRRAAGTEALKPLYSRLIEQVATLNRLVDETLARLTPESITDPARQALEEQLRHYRALSQRVVEQARRRILQGEAVPNPEKLFSIFEPHTELLMRGKAVCDIEFGHMLQIQQVEGKYITAYEVFAHKPHEAALLDSALEHHKALFGAYPREVAADKGYAQNRDQFATLSSKVAHVAISKAGTPTAADRRREHTRRFRLAHCFRAGVEGTISYLKRALGLARCPAKGWSHYVAAVGAALLAHNLLILARD